MAKAEKKHAAIYCRVSTYNQGQGDYSSLDAQKDLLQRYAEAKNWVVHDIYVDTKTGATLERDELNRLLKDAKAHRFDIVLATKLDRISRSMKDFLEINETLNENDVDLVLATQNIDPTSSGGRFNRNVLMAFAEFEREMIVERTREKLYSQAQKGYWGGGHAPLGYDVKEKKLVVNKAEADLVQRIFHMYLKDPSTNRIAAELNKEGYRTKSRVTKKGGSKGGGDFNKQVVRDMLRNKIYLGLISYKKEDFKGLHEPMVDQQLFDDVQDRLDESAVNKMITHQDSELPLTGITKCGLCGAYMSSSYTKRKDTGEEYYYYKCTTKNHYGASKCESKDISAEDLENFIEKVIVEAGSDEPFFSAIAKQFGQNSSEETKELKAKKVQLTHNLSKVKNEIANVVRAISSSPELKESNAIGASLKEKEESQKQIENEVSVVDRKLLRISEQRTNRSELKKIFQEFGTLYKNAPSDLKRKLTHLLILEIRSYLKKKESKGNLEIFLNGDGSIVKEWEVLRKKKSGTPGGSAPSNVPLLADPQEPFSSSWGLWLRE